MRPIAAVAELVRSALFHDLDAPATIEVNAAGAFLDVPILIESAAWYSPQQIASARPTPSSIR